MDFNEFFLAETPEQEVNTEVIFEIDDADVSCEPEWITEYDNMRVQKAIDWLEKMELYL